MTVFRLTNNAGIVKFWDFIALSLGELHTKSHQPVDLEAVKKTLVWTVPDTERTWCAVVIEDNEPIAFAVAHDTTPPFDPHRTFQVRWFYHKTGKFSATYALMADFEHWASQNGIAEYAVTTARTSGAAIKCFQSSRLGFRRAYTTYIKTL
jgi:hypothetical protein